MSCSISSTAWFAPPCSGPNRALTPAETDANRLAWEDPTSRTVDVEQFCSWSACSTNSMSSTLATTGSTSYGMAGTPNVMRRKFSTYPSELSGYSDGCPIDFLYAYDAMVGTLARRRTVEISTWSLSNGLRL